MIAPVFVSHGAPTLPFDDVTARTFLAGLPTLMPRPKAILVISAHWETDVPTVNAVAQNATIHDFYGFPPALYQISYPAPGDVALAERVTDLLSEAGLGSAMDRRRGLDHGAWVPLMLAWPEADIPVVQLSVQGHLGPGHHYHVGQALRPLADDGVLILASGSFTHNLAQLDRNGGNAAAPWAGAFADWMASAIAEGRTCDLLSYRNLAPFAVQSHPTEEHILPLFVALGAGGKDVKGDRLHASSTFGTLRMDAFAFSSKTPTQEERITP